MICTSGFASSMDVDVPAIRVVPIRRLDSALSCLKRDLGTHMCPVAGRFVEHGCKANRLVYAFCSKKLADEASVSSIGSTASSPVGLRPQSG